MTLGENASVSAPDAMLPACVSPLHPPVVIELPTNYELPAAAHHALLRLLLAVHERRTQQAA
jgi:hypothetical protein